MNICIGLIGTINNIMEQKQYTAKQWSEIEGGHTMSETPKKQYAFIGDMLESKMFRSKGKVEGSNARDITDTAGSNATGVDTTSIDATGADTAGSCATDTAGVGATTNTAGGSATTDAAGRRDTSSVAAAPSVAALAVSSQQTRSNNSWPTCRAAVEARQIPH